MATGEADRYFSTQTDMDEIAEQLGHKFMDLEMQINRTAMQFPTI